MSDGKPDTPPKEVPPNEDDAGSTNDSQADSGQGKTDDGPPSTPLEVVISGNLKIEAESKHTEAEDKSSRWPHPLTWFTGALAFFTLALVFVGGFQARILYVTNETLSLQQRAWLAPRELAVPENFINQTNAYTEVPLRYENLGREPATRINIVVGPSTIKLADFRNEQVMAATIRSALGDRCEPARPDPNGIAVFPGSSAGVVIGFDSQLVERINTRKYYALVVGCLAYETLKEPHLSKFCVILEPVKEATPRDWRTSFCTIHNDAD